MSTQTRFRFTNTLIKNLPPNASDTGSTDAEYSDTEILRIPLYSITDWHRSPISDSHPFDQPGT
ncbi:hypothetical protein ZA09F29_06750 [Escherichia coli]